jgi:pyruvate/2-oxoglutarate dehydrogenase complex dihydrolipoamide dehydrogenase (E3) component
MAYALGSEQVLLTGPLFATGSLSHKDNRSALNTLKALPEDMAVFGGGAHDRPLIELLRAGQAG